MAKILIVMLLFAVPAHAQTFETISVPIESATKTPNFNKETAIFAAAATADWISTAHFMSYGIPEHFPIHKGWKHNAVAVIGVGAAIDAASVLIARKIGKRHPKLARLAFYGASAMRFYIAFDNERDLRREVRSWGGNCVKRCF